MALIICPECRKSISDFSEMCIGCGFPIKKYLDEQETTREEDKKKQQEYEESMGQYFCYSCQMQNEIGEDYCLSCGNRLTPYHKKDKEYICVQTEEEPVEFKAEFHGIYRWACGKRIEIYCPRCGSEYCSHTQKQKIIPGKTKTRYTANLNPLRPFTFVNKKEKVVKEEQIVTESIIVCNSCGNIFK